MEYKEFKSIVNDCKSKKPVLFGLKQDAVCNLEQIGELERILQIILPEKYKRFIMDFGGGYFGYANIYSLDLRSDFYLLAHNTCPIKNYLRIADNGCGDYYLMKLDNNKCLDRVFFYEHDTANIRETGYEDILEYLIDVGLKV